jgi:hypothetical protein
MRWSGLAIKDAVTLERNHWRTLSQRKLAEICETVGITQVRVLANHMHERYLSGYCEQQRSTSQFSPLKVHRAFLQFF